MESFDPLIGAYLTWIAERARLSVIKAGPKEKPKPGRIVVSPPDPHFLVLVEYDDVDEMGYVISVSEANERPYQIPIEEIFDWDEIRNSLAEEIRRIMDLAIQEQSRWN